MTAASVAFRRPAGPSTPSMAVPTHSASALNASCEAARAPGHQLAPRPRRRHRHRQARLERLPAVRRQQQPAGPVAGHAPDRDALGRLVAQPRVQARHRRRHLAAGGAGVMAQAPAVRQRQPRHHRPPGVVGPEHRRAHVAAERQRALAAGEARLRPAAPEREDAAVALAVHGEVRAGQQVAAAEAHLQEAAAVQPTRRTRAHRRSAAEPGRAEPRRVERRAAAGHPDRAGHRPAGPRHQRAAAAAPRHPRRRSARGRRAGHRLRGRPYRPDARRTRSRAVSGS